MIGGDQSVMTGAQAVIFDCDSTLCEIEGIDELGSEHAEEIRALTNAAMDGSVPLQEVYGRRLEIIRPTHAQVEALARLYVERLVTDARETVAALKWLGKDVRIISGGLLPPVVRVALELGLEADDVAAVGIDFDAEGAYAGFDRESPLARSGGKLEVVRRWSLSRPVVLVGDGATDLEARPAVDLFVGYMGVAYRPTIAAEADVVLTAPSLSPVLALAADSADRERLQATQWEQTLARGITLLGDATR